VKIKVFVRHCNFSSNSVGKNRPEWFSREKCWNNLLETSDENTEVTAIFDGEPKTEHFLHNDTRNYKLVCKHGGTDGHSFLNLLEYVHEQNIEDDTILYFVEDDFYHKPGWVNILREGFEYIGADYITLYDHNDKYFLPMYNDLQSKIIATPSIHWRTTPSTTNTYAMLYQTFKKHYNIHKEYCDLQKGFTRDHDKFIRLWNEGSNLISCLPGYSTHCETEYLSPCIDWSKI
jgi:glycosyltransferase involved in cell wall biosynthesis